MSQIELKNIMKKFDNNYKAIDNLSLIINDGEMLVLVGPSGCGKSTLLRIIAGLENASSGDILLDNKSISNLTPQKRDIAMIFQNYALYPHMTVFQNIAFPLKMMKSKKRKTEEKVRDIAGLLKLEELLNRKPAELSGGQCQRVAMGRALVRNPKVFLMDEPLSNLDAKLRVLMRSEISEMQKELKTTTIYVTHDQVEAMTMGDRVAVLKNGIIQQVGSPQEIYNNPANVFVATFIGNPGMNLVYSKIENDNNGDKFFYFNDKVIPLPQRYKKYCQQNAIIGLRPESFFIPEEKNELIETDVQISHIEELGHEFIIYFPIKNNNLPTNILNLITSNPVKQSPQSLYKNDQIFTTRLPNNVCIKNGDTIKLGINTNKLLLFNEKGEAF